MNDNQLQIFNYEGKEIRTVEINGEPWFVLRDVCDILSISKIDAVIARLDEDETSQTGVIDKIGRKQQMAIVNESGLYNVILRSDKPEAKPFRKHVTSVILPEIRKNGGYVADEDKFAEIYFNGIPDVYKDFFKGNLKAMKYLSEENSRLKKNVESLTEQSTAKDKVIAAQITSIHQKNEEIEQAKPKVEFYDTVADTKENISVSKFAKLLCKMGANVGQNRLFDWFRSKGYLMQNNEPYQQYVNAGYFYVHEFTMYIKGVPTVGTKTLITGKGQQYFYKKIMQDFSDQK